MGRVIRCQDVFLSCFTCTRQGDHVELYLPFITALVGSAYDTASCPVIQGLNPLTAAVKTGVLGGKATVEKPPEY